MRSDDDCLIRVHAVDLARARQFTFYHGREMGQERLLGTGEAG